MAYQVTYVPGPDTSTIGDAALDRRHAARAGEVAYAVHSDDPALNKYSQNGSDWLPYRAPPAAPANRSDAPAPMTVLRVDRPRWQTYQRVDHGDVVVTVDVNGEEASATLAELREAADQDDRRLAAAYAGVVRQAEAMIAAWLR